MRSLYLFILTALFMTTLATGCRAKECQQMQKCCDALSGMEGLGNTCGELAKQTKDPTTCRTVLRTLTYLVEEQGQTEIPAQCR